MKLAYIDTSIWITRVEGLAIYREKIDKTLNDIVNDNWTICISDAVILETLVKPYKQKQEMIICAYNKIFESTITLESFKNVFKNALLIAQTENLKPMDAVHVSIAVQHRCRRFISTDPNFKNLKIIPCTWINLAE